MDLDRYVVVPGTRRRVDRVWYKRSRNAVNVCTCLGVYVLIGFASAAVWEYLKVISYVSDLMAWGDQIGQATEDTNAIKQCMEKMGMCQ